MAPNPKDFPVTWEEMHRNGKALAWRLIEKGPWKGVIAVARGGLVPAWLKRPTDGGRADAGRVEGDCGEPGQIRQQVVPLRHLAGDVDPRPVEHRDRADPLATPNTVADPNGDHDWGISAEIDLAASDAEGRAVVKVTDVGQL